MATTVHVENISRQTSEKEVKDFFSFCGKIRTISVTPVSDTAQSATVTFEKETAAKTALLLDQTQLGPAQVHVTAAKSLDDLTSGSAGTEGQKEDHHDVTQEDKPRSRIVAEYLAHGYTISDKAIERAINLDQQHGISNRFTNALKVFDEKVKATDKAQAVDAKLGVTDKSIQGWRGMNSYFEKALGTPTGQKVRKFYETTSKQVIDVHNEARHLADLKKSTVATPEQIPGSEKTKCTCTADSGKCGCAPGQCACSGCAKNADTKSKVGVEEAQMEQVPGTDKTKCNCGATAEKCPCPPGKCACASCAKNPDASKTVPPTGASSQYPPEKSTPLS